MIYWGYLYAKFNSNQLASPSSLLTFLRACPYIVMCLCVCVCICVSMCMYLCLPGYVSYACGLEIVSKRIPKQNQKTNLR